MIKTKFDEKYVNDSDHGDTVPIVIDFGTRAISSLRFSKMVILPKIALANCDLDKATRVRVQLVQDKGSKYIRILPYTEQQEEAKN